MPREERCIGSTPRSRVASAPNFLFSAPRKRLTLKAALMAKCRTGALSRRFEFDIGGDPWYWENVADLLGHRQCHVTLLNQTAYVLDHGI
jgi:hypothetical protein